MIAIETPRRWDRETQTKRRMRQLQRVLHVAYVVRREPCSTLAEIHRSLREEFGLAICEKTVRRDLDALEDLGMVEHYRLDSFGARVGRKSVYEFSDDLNFWPFEKTG